MVKYRRATTRADIIFLEIVAVELRAFLKPVDSLKQSFKVSLFAPRSTFLYLIDHMLFHMLDVSLAMFSYLLIVADILFSTFKILEITFFCFGATSYSSQEIFAHQVFHEVCAFGTDIVILVMF